jgi:hypothetical protein
MQTGLIAGQKKKVGKVVQLYESAPKDAQMCTPLGAI